MRLRRKSRGIITVFVTLIMIPVVVFTGLFVDAARIKLYSSQAAMAADAYGEVVLSEYDNLLKDLYGLFSVTQNAEGLQAIQDLAAYTGYSFSPPSSGKELKGFMPYKNATVEIKYEKVAGADLVNENVLMTQISDFMRYRAIASLLENADILDVLGEIDDTSGDMEAVKKRTEITDESQEILEKIGDYYVVLSCVYQYQAYCQERSQKYLECSTALYQIYSNQYKVNNKHTYGDYVYYLENTDDIKATIKKVEDAKTDDSIEISNVEIRTADKYADFDVETYKNYLQGEFYKYNLDVQNTSFNIHYGLVSTALSQLDSLAKSIDKEITTLHQQVEDLKEALKDCSSATRTGMEAEIRDLENILDLEGEFSKLVNLLRSKNVVSADEYNLSQWASETAELYKIQSDMLDGKMDLNISCESFSYEWFHFYTQDTTSRDFYDNLQAACNTADGSVKGDKDAGDTEIEKAETAEKNAKAKISGEEQTEARSISDDLAKYLLASNSLPIPDLDSCITAELTVSGASGAMSGLLLTMYDYNMFSSRVSGIEKKEEGNTSQTGNGTQGTSTGTTSGTGTQTGGEKQEYYDESLTKVKMSKDVNYLYGAELEYLLGGYNSSKDNLAYTRNVICGVRLGMNFASTYAISDVNSAISEVANIAASAVASSGVGAFVAPLVRVLVSGALRLAVAAIETAKDWELLLEREDVIFFKKELGHLSCIEDLKGLIKINDAPKNNEGIKLSYEDYVFVLLLKDAVVNSEQLLHRTSNLITLNVNQCQNTGDELTTLNFQMKNTITAVKSTCTVNIDFVIVPKNIINRFMVGKNAGGIIQKLEDDSYGYSVIRGY